MLLKNSLCSPWDHIRSPYCRDHSYCIFQIIRDHRVECIRYRSLLTLYETNDIQVGGLLFSGLLISTLGAVMDVAMSISSAMKEIYDQNHQITACSW